MLRISKGTKYLYTLKDIIEDENPELWNRAQAQSKRFADLQEMVISVLSSRRKQLPKDGEQLKDVDGQIAFLSYILACSLYAFAERVFMLLDKQCAELAKALNDYDRYAEEDALAKVERTLEILANAPLEEIAYDSVTGLLRLSRVTYEFEHRLDFPVFHMEKADWTFHDIMGTIANLGLCREDLLQDAINCALPTCVSVGRLLDDSTMWRVY